MSLSSAESVATTLVTALNESGLATFSRNRFPKYALKDLTQLKADVVLPPAYQVQAHDQCSVYSTVEVDILLQQRVEKTDTTTIEALHLKLDQIARYLWANEIDGLGLPSEPSTVGVVYEVLDQGHFCGGVSVTYRVFFDEA